ncbi:aspartic peptidase domain-containing protein [Boeremia exigua]|uniref:aspartic peptidase domain-containing protein n=1 Tax=Boeremia exigua TaxID=749465 RepID=UPI001E8D741A|nr:aspartic peptidase domain-containing protein [Boeremia exigua]KAH6618750.1 aspartic peptidase domain-containing protein [Boeremia exigua]
MTTSQAVAPYSVPPSQHFDGNDGSWSTFAISVGIPGQDFRVLPSTKSGVTYVIAPEGCSQPTDPTNCANLRGAEIFGSTQNTGFQVARSTQWSAIGQYGVDLEDALNMTAEGLFGYDHVALGPAADTNSDGNVIAIDRQVVAAIADMDYFMGVLPLGQAESSFSSLSEPQESLIWNLRNSSRIPSLSYAYTAGAKYESKSVFGSLILGGYDSTRFTPNANDFSFTFSSDPSRLLTVGVESVMATNTLKGTFSLSSGAHFSVIDSTATQLWLPTDICTQFEEAFGLTYDPYTDLYLVNDTIHTNLTTLNPIITIKLVNSLQDTATNYTNIELPYAAFDLQASYPYYTNATRYFPIRRAANDTQYVLGRTLLQEAYLIVDYERGNFTVAPAVFPDPLPAAQIITIKSLADGQSKSSSSSSLGAGAIAGIAVGAALLLAIIGLAAFCFTRKRRRGAQKYELAASEAKDAGSDAHLTGAGSNAALKARVPLPPQEMGGTPLTELASPAVLAFPTDHKRVISMNSAPVELHADSAVPRTPASATKWEEVRTSGYDSAERDGESSAIPTENMSWAPSDDATMINSPRSAGHGTGVSPLTETFGKR